MPEKVTMQIGNQKIIKKIITSNYTNILSILHRRFNEIVNALDIQRALSSDPVKVT